MSDTILTRGPGAVDQLLASSLHAYLEKTPVDQVFNKRPAVSKMLSKAKKMDGGSTIVTNVMYEKNETAANYDGADVLDITPQAGYTDTQAEWKQAAVSISLIGRLLRQNSGASKVFDIIDQKRQQAMDSLEDKVNDNLFAAAVGSKAPESLVTMILASGTVQGVNSSTSSWWQSTVTTGGSFATQGLSDLRTTYSTLDKKQPSSRIDMLLSTDTVYNYYEGSLTPNTRYSDGETPTGSFSGLKFKDATMFYDAAATSGVIYMFSTDDLHFVINSGANFTMTEFVKPANQDVKTAQIILMYQMCTRARRKLGKITSITA